MHYLNIRSKEHVQFATHIEKKGQIDVVVNNAGLITAGTRIRS